MQAEEVYKRIVDASERVKGLYPHNGVYVKTAISVSALNDACGALWDEAYSILGISRATYDVLVTQTDAVTTVIDMLHRWE